MKIQKIDDKFYDITEWSQSRLDMGYRGTPVLPRFEHFTTEQHYKNSGVKGITPMTAKEIDTEEQQDMFLNDPHYYVEEKFDGTRATLHFLTPKSLKQGDMSKEEYFYMNTLLKRGSGVEEGKNRIYEYFISHPSNSDRANFLNKEYGTGGGTVIFPDNTRGMEMHSSKGFELSIDRNDKSNVLYTWANVADYVGKMIDNSMYYPKDAYTRCFSRRISEKTGWFCENTDSLPQLREIEIPELSGTIIDGEMFIPDRPFKDVSSTLNCKWDKAIDRQIDLGFIVFHAFDILFYKGIDLRKMSLERRKAYLQLVVDKVNSPYIDMVKYYDDKVPITIDDSILKHGDTYPTLYSEWYDTLFPHYGEMLVSKKAYYEYIVMNGGEGVILKPKDGKYWSKRGREYQKIKKFLTREVIIMGFTEPTKEYKGKFPDDHWDYWVDQNDVKQSISFATGRSAKDLLKRGYTPVTKYYFENWVGNIRFGVVITEEELKSLPKNKKFNVECLTTNRTFEATSLVNVVEVGECSGFDESIRQLFTCNALDHEGTMIHCEDEEEIERNDSQHHCWRGTVIEVKANEIFKDTGKLRHPRFLRIREDKAPLECTWRDHIGE